MRAMLLVTAALLATASTTSAEARGRIRFRLPWSTSAPSAPAAPAASTGRPGSVILPLGALAAGASRAAEPPASGAPQAEPTAAAAPTPPPAAAQPLPSAPPRAVEVKVDPCAKATRIGTGTGFCSFD